MSASLADPPPGVPAHPYDELAGKTSFSAQQLTENYFATIDEIMRLKPSTSKGRYMKKIVVSRTMGPGVSIDPSKVTPAGDEA